jgi:cysteine desulfuration protein SufE
MVDDLSFDERVASCPVPLQEIIGEFQEVEPRERLEYLLEYAMDLPDLPERLHAARDGMEQVHECQSPVFLHTEMEGGRLQLYLDIPVEAPTVRGYGSILVSGLSGAPAEAVLAAPEDIYMLLGLHEAISPQRLRGLHALMVHIKRQVVALAG